MEPNARRRRARPARKLGSCGPRRLGDLGRLAADIGHVRLDGLAFATKRASCRRGLHDLADAVRQEPSGLHAAIEHPLDLAGADALLAGAHQVDGLQPQMQREMAVLEDRADPHREGLAAGVALPQARTAGLARQAADPLFIAIAAMRANRAFGPKVGLDVGESGFLVVEMGGGQNGLGHAEISYGLNTIHSVWGCQV